VNISDTTPTQHVVGKIERRLAIVYSCGVCSHRFTKSFSHHAYTKGIVIIKCPSCEKLHLIADNLGWFEPSHKIGNTIEETLKLKGGEHQVLKFNIEEFMNGDKFKDLPQYIQEQIIHIKNSPIPKKKGEDSNHQNIEIKDIDIKKDN